MAAAVLVGVAGLDPVATGAQVSSSAAALDPVVMTETFSGDSLGQWASYPPAQDVGYEPSLTPTAEFGAPGGRALMRVVRPVVKGPLRIGFIKEVNLVMSQGADLAFAYRIEPAGSAGEIEVGLAGGDGHRYTVRLPASSGAWTSTDMELSELKGAGGRSIPLRTRIEAVYIVASIEQATPDTTTRFLLDDVRLSASREAAFDVRLPAATRLEPWRALASSTVHRAGSILAIEAAAAFPLSRATWSLNGPADQTIASGTLRDDGASGDRTAGDGNWSHAAAYRIGAGDPSGVWQLVLEGATVDGQRIASEVRLLVLPPRSAPHPRLYFDMAAAGKIRARRQHPALTALWATLRKSAAASRETGPIAHGGDVFARLDSTYLLPSLLGYFDVLNRARSRITGNAAVGFLDDDRDARGAARTALLEVSRWPMWTPPWFEAHGQHTYYPAGQLASAVALAYDLLYHELSSDERRLVRRALLERSILPTWREYVLDNRVMADTSNWISHTVGGAIIAAAAIFGDGSADEEDALALPLNGLLMKIEDHMAASFLQDGSYGEGISYLEFDLETLGPMLRAVERVFGQSYWERTNVLASLQYHLHTLAEPISESFDMGDTHPPGGHNIASIVARSNDPVIRWYGSRFERRTIYDFLFFDDTVSPRAPEGFGSRLFDVKGNAVFRTGWDPDAGIVLFRAGPTFNHNHSDQGSFQFRAFGETLVTEAGWSDYYKDPYYDTFFTQAVGHNTLIVDANPASQGIADTAQFDALDRYPRITDATLSGFYDAVGSDLTPVYGDRLESYGRRLAYLKPDYLVVFDRVRVKGQPARLNWLLHVPAKSGITHEDASTSALYAGARAALAIRPFSSTEISLTIRNGRIPYPVFAARTPATVPPQPAYLDLATVRPVRDAWYLVALVPARSAEAASSAAADLKPVAAAGWTGLSATRAGQRHLVAFSTGVASREVSLEGWRTDAQAWVATLAGTDLRWIGAQQVRVFAQGERTLIESDRQVSVALEVGPAGLQGVVQADRPARLRIHVRQAPARVTIAGNVVPSAYDAAAELLSLAVPAGSSAIAISASGR